MMGYCNIDLIIFEIFVLSGTGWALESAQESIVRRKFVNKGFFKGPYIPIHGIGGICVYELCLALKMHPALVFLSGMVVCTVFEYLTALFLDHCFKVKAWDYTTYPHTKWCNYKGRVCLTMSLIFGILTLFLVYGYMDFIGRLARLLGAAVLPLDGYLLGIFTADAIYSCARIARLNKQGIKIIGFNVFTDTQNMRG
jgi:uncharacterized membrane protein